MGPENRALAVMTLAVVVVTTTGGVTAYLLGGKTKLVVPAGSFTLEARFAPYGSSWTAFTSSNNRTAAYEVTGVWAASAPVQVIVAEVLGINYGGCWFSPLNFPSGAPAFGCWPDFEASPQGVFGYAFHICVRPGYLPTGSFLIIFRSNESTEVTVTQPFAVQQSGFPPSECVGPLS